MNWIKIQISIALAILSFVFSFLVFAERINWDSLYKGDVQVRAVENYEGLQGVKAFFTVSASKDRIWEVLLDYGNFPKFFKGIIEMKIISSDTENALIQFKIDAVLKTFTYVLQREYNKSAWLITWRRQSGDLKRIEGSWQIKDTPRAEKKLLIYESYVEVGGIIPTALVRWVAMGKTREMGHRLRKWIEKQPKDR